MPLPRKKEKTKIAAGQPASAISPFHPSDFNMSLYFFSNFMVSKKTGL